MIKRKDLSPLVGDIERPHQLVADSVSATSWVPSR
jgi:hypothetical protein